MKKKNIDWSSLGFGYVQTDYRYVSKFKDGTWDAIQLAQTVTLEVDARSHHVVDGGALHVDAVIIEGDRKSVV